MRLSLGSIKEKSKEEMEAVILNAGPATKPAETIWYTDQGYYLLGKVIEIVSGKPLDMFFKRSILKLGMEKHSFNPSPRIKNKIALTEDCLWRNKLVWGEVHTESAYKLGGISGYSEPVFNSGRFIIKIGSFWLNNGDGIVDKNLINESKMPPYP